jgi:hypothetical protein
METQFKHEAVMVGTTIGIATGALTSVLSYALHYHPLLVLAEVGLTVAVGAGVDRLIRLTHAPEQVRKAAARATGLVLGLINAVVLVLTMIAVAGSEQFQTTLKNMVHTTADQTGLLSAMVFAFAGLVLIGLPAAGAIFATWGATLYEDRHPQTRPVVPSIAHSHR